MNVGSPTSSPRASVEVRSVWPTSSMDFHGVNGSKFTSMEVVSHFHGSRWKSRGSGYFRFHGSKLDQLPRASVEEADSTSTEARGSVTDRVLELDTEITPTLAWLKGFLWTPTKTETRTCPYPATVSSLNQILRSVPVYTATILQCEA